MWLRSSLFKLSCSSLQQLHIPTVTRSDRPVQQESEQLHESHWRHLDFSQKIVWNNLWNKSSFILHICANSDMQSLSFLIHELQPVTSRLCLTILLTRLYLKVGFNISGHFNKRPHWSLLFQWADLTSIMTLTQAASLNYLDNNPPPTHPSPPRLIRIS